MAPGSQPVADSEGTLQRRFGGIRHRLAQTPPFLRQVFGVYKIKATSCEMTAILYLQPHVDGSEKHGGDEG